jgi:hypothetical protein
MRRPRTRRAEQIAAASPSPSPTPPRPSGPIEFTDVTSEAGIRFKHNSGAFGKKYLPETIGAGGAFLDYDNDGWQDILLVNSMDWPENKKRKSFPALYHNNKDGTFTDVTQQRVLGVEMYGIGVAVADYDNDGNDDIYITCVGPNRLFRNLGGGKFADVSARAGVGDPGFQPVPPGSTSTTTASSISLSATTSTGLCKRISTARSTQEQVVLHAANLQRPERFAVSQSRQRHF